MHVNLRVKIAGIELRNPLMLASGILGISSELLKRAEKGGAGGVVTKTITKNPISGYENPVIVELKYGYINAMGLPNPGIDYFSEEIRNSKELLKVPLIVSIGGSDEKELKYVAVKAVRSGADGIELNASCPHVKGYGVELISDPNYIKLSVHHNIVDVAKKCIEGGADGIVAINTIRAMAIDISSGKPILSNRYGGLSGPAIHPIAVRCVYELYEEVKDIPIIGVGGISSWKDVIEFIMAGASAVQLGSIIANKGTVVFNLMVRRIKRFLKEKKFKDIRELIGYAH